MGHMVFFPRQFSTVNILMCYVSPPPHMQLGLHSIEEGSLELDQPQT